MTLAVIGSGLGRTGTMSLKLALEQLGLGPCHHMTEVFQHPESIPLWVAAGAGHPDWNAIFDGYGAMVDYPGCKFWRALMDFYPDAKIIHTIRDPEAWFQSTQSTIFAPHSMALSSDSPFAAFFGMITADYGDKLHDRDFMIAYFERHTETVLEAVPKDRLLVYEASHGWEPLCRFLELAEPTGAFPHVNSRAEFQARHQPAGAMDTVTD
jgi:hypothetical protein